MRAIVIGNLRLEPQLAAHAEEMFALLSDPALYRYENAPPASVEALRERFSRLEGRRSPDGAELWLNWVLRLEGVGLVGYVQATVRSDGLAGIAYVLGSSHWGRGLASRAVKAMIAELGDEYGTRTVFAILKRENERSRKLLERLGFADADSELRILLGAERDESLMMRRIS
jgi:[ribosomal protein S5]-alanine N-acetyltransferase